MAPKSFNELSTDLKALIIEQVNRPTDLKNICVVSKACHELAIRSLYHTVSLDVGGPPDLRLTAFLNPRNKGLQYVRRVVLYLEPERHICMDVRLRQANLATKMIIEFLPENVLEEFSWCPWSSFSSDNLILLYKRQKRLKWLEAMTLDSPNALLHLEAKPAEYDELFSSCTMLAFYPESRETLDLCHLFLRRTKNLQELILHTNFDHLGITSREANDTAVGPGLVTRTIFSHMLPFDKCTPFANLRALRLQKINLRHCSETYCKIVNFTNLTALRIHQCSGADALLAELCKSACLPHYLEVLEVQHADNEEHDALNALDGLLCLISGLRDLVIDIDNVKALPAAAGICRHSKTLELLNVHTIARPTGETTGHHYENVWLPDDFDKICESVVHLEQLSCAFPPPHIFSSPSVHWQRFAKAVGSLRNLVTLNILNWLSCKTAEDPVPPNVYEHNLQLLASSIFHHSLGSNAVTAVPGSAHLTVPTDNNTVFTTGLLFLASQIPSMILADLQNQPKVHATPSKMRLVAFGTSDSISERRDSQTQMIYYLSTYAGPDGRTWMIPTPIGWCLRKYLEPRSDVLDQGLARVSCMPARGWELIDDDD